MKKKKKNLKNKQLFDLTAVEIKMKNQKRVVGESRYDCTHHLRSFHTKSVSFPLKYTVHAQTWK